MRGNSAAYNPASSIAVNEEIARTITPLVSVWVYTEIRRTIRAVMLVRGSNIASRARTAYKSDFMGILCTHSPAPQKDMPPPVRAAANVTNNHIERGTNPLWRGGPALRYCDT